jgi:hypothetical protein
VRLCRRRLDDFHFSSPEGTKPQAQRYLESTLTSDSLGVIDGGSACWCDGKEVAGFEGVPGW